MHSISPSLQYSQQAYHFLSESMVKGKDASRSVGILIIHGCNTQQKKMLCFASRVVFLTSLTIHQLCSTGFRDWKHARGKGGTLSYHDSQMFKTP